MDWGQLRGSRFWNKNLPNIPPYHMCTSSQLMALPYQFIKFVVVFIGFLLTSNVFLYFIQISYKKVQFGSFIFIFMLLLCVYIVFRLFVKVIPVKISYLLIVYLSGYFYLYKAVCNWNWGRAYRVSWPRLISLNI